VVLIELNKDLVDLVEYSRMRQIAVRLPSYSRSLVAKLVEIDYMYIRCYRGVP